MDGLDFKEEDYSEKSHPHRPGTSPTYMGSLEPVPSATDSGIKTTRELQRHIYTMNSRQELLELGKSTALELDPSSLVSYVKRWG